MTVPSYQWQPTTPEIARRAGIDRSAVVRFDQNTSPFLAPWVPAEAARAARALNEYPVADYSRLRESVAAYAGVAPEQVVTGAGADELIDVCAKTFLSPEGIAVGAPPTYALYRIATAQRGARLVEVPRREPDFSLPVEDVITAAARADLIWLCVPNNPIGRRDPDSALMAVLEASKGVVVIDAAYSEFCGDRWAGWIERHPRLVVLGTLSKAFGLAGIRVGYSISSPELAGALHTRRPPGSISTVSAELATRAMQEPERAAANVEATIDERSRLGRAFSAMGFHVYPSATNFVLARVGPDAASISEKLMWERGLVVRTFAADGPLAEHLRCTVRLPAENDRLLTALAEVTS